MNRTLYWGSGSGASWRALLGLLVKGLDYESHRLNPSKREQKQPEYLALNPRGTFPTLCDGDIVVRDSMAILHYLDAAYPQPPLFGSTPAETALVAQQCAELTDYLLPALGGFIRPLFRGKVEGNEESIAACLKTIHEELGTMEQLLAKNQWLAGELISAADIVLFPEVQRSLRAATREGADEFDHGMTTLHVRYPALARWVGAVEAIPGYQDTYPPHWRP
jgi:glutathione S-transferase